MGAVINEMKGILDQNSEKHINVNKTMVERFEKLNGNTYNVMFK